MRVRVGPDVDVERHFTPKYKPWDQRLCLVPNADLFRALKAGHASIVTDEIRHFNATGLELRSGEQLDADIIVTATGLNLLPFGGISLRVDDAEIDPAETFIYKGSMLNGVPNFAWCAGYTNASWTLRADLPYVCRLLNYMSRKRFDFTVPELRKPMEPRQMFDLMQAKHSPFGRPHAQGSTAPWHFRQNYLLDSVTMRTSRLTDHMRFGKKGSAWTSLGNGRSSAPAMRSRTSDNGATPLVITSS